MIILLILFTYLSGAASISHDPILLEPALESIANCPVYPTRFGGPSWINLSCVINMLNRMAPALPTEARQLKSLIDQCPIQRHRLKLRFERRIHRQCVIQQLEKLNQSK